MTIRNETTRLFYSKWLYKISLRLPGVSVMRYKNDVSHLSNYFNDHRQDSYYPHSLYNRAAGNKDKLIELGLLLNNYKKETYQKRIEGDLLDLYTNDTNLIKHVEMEFNEYIRLIAEPDPKNIDQLVSQEKSIFVKRLPHKRFQYRVYLKPHCGTYDKKSNFVTWLAQQGDKTTLSKSLTNWFLNTDINWDRRYILIEDENLILFMKLHSPEFVGTIYKFVIKDK